MTSSSWITDTADFSRNYAEARLRFRAAAQAAGAGIKAWVNPNRGPEDCELATDCAWFGPGDASRVMVALSATHGVEGYSGSAAQLSWMRHGGPESLPEGTAALLVHAVNPWGFAWDRRVSEEGVDLNRNWVDFTKPLPENPGYDALADFILPLSSSAIGEAEAALSAYAATHGESALEEAVSGGQYKHPAGLFYGGTSPTWSRRTIEDAVAHFGLGKRRQVAVIDLHTGLGPFGHGEPICDHPPGSVGARRAKSWYGHSVTEPALGNSCSVAKTGLSDYGWQDMLGDALTFVVLEFGTFATRDMFRVLRNDHMLYRDGAPDPDSPETRKIRQAIRNHFYPATRDWQEMILFRSRQVMDQAVAGMQAN